MSTSQDWSAAGAELDAGRWASAADLFATLAATTSDPRAHEGLAQAAWWLDDADTALGAREAAYRGYRAAGEARGAARAAVHLGYDSMLFGRGAAVGKGWLARAADLLAEQDDVPERGWLAVRQAEVALTVDRDARAALAAAGRAVALGRALAVNDLVVVGQALSGLANVRLGQVEAGTEELDAAATAATAGDVEDLMWMGKICCWLISACEETHDLARASDWCARVEEICVRRRLSPLLSVCRIQYASVLLASGRPDEAESTLVDVLSVLQHSRRLSRFDAVAQLGELRRRQGRSREAEELLAQAADLPAAAISLARLRLGEGDPARAWSGIAEALRSTAVDHPLDRVDALAVAVAAGIASGRTEEATSAAAELRLIARTVGTAALSAHADAAHARLAQGRDAVELWQDAVRRFGAAGLIFDEAEARLELVAALRASGEDLEAEEQQTRALLVLAPLRGRGAAAPTAPLTERQAEVLGLLAQGLSNREIATGLCLSEHTVHRHLSNIYDVLGLHSRAGAAAYAVAHGLA